MFYRRLALSTSTLALLATPICAFAQVTVTDARTAGLSTSTATDATTPGDLTITSTGSVTITSGAALTLDSSNALINSGIVTATDVDDVTGVLISGGNTGSFSNTSSITIDEAADAAFVDGVLPDNADIAVGAGRTGILISGGGDFTGNVENSATIGSITVRGQDSAGIQLASTANIVGDLIQDGALSVFGERSIGIDVIGNVIGNLAVGGGISSAGEDAQAINVAGDISGGVEVTSTISNTGFVANSGTSVTFRPDAASRDILIDSGGTDHAGSLMQISGNVGSGVLVGETRSDEGVLLRTASLSQFGSAPAILIDGEGTPIAFGQVSVITDTTDPDFNAEHLYAFVNQGTISTNGLLDDLDATTLSVADATLTGGINNTRTMSASVFRSGIDPATTVTNDAHARVVVIGNAAIADRINNSGVIVAQGQDAIDSIYLDPDNILPANRIQVTAIDVETGGSLASIDNTGAISALLTGREGDAIAIRDSSDTLTMINNGNLIQALAVNSDATGAQATNFTTAAIDVRSNTAGLTYNQTVTPGATADDADTIPQTQGDILLGSGDDMLNIAGGFVSGDIAFGDGMDTLSLSNTSSVTGGLSDNDGQLAIMVADNSLLAITSAADISATSVDFDATSTYSPFIDPNAVLVADQVSTLNLSGTAVFADGAQIAPRLSAIPDDASSQFEIVNAAGGLTVDTSLATLRSDQTPWLYDTAVNVSATDPNVLVLTLDLRQTSELGLDTQQSSAFTSAFEALQATSALGSAFTGIADEGQFNAAYNQLLPEFAAGARQFVIANVDGAAGAVGTHLNAARRSPERPGGAWIQEFTYYADRELAGLSEQFRGYGFGFTGGFDTAFGPFHTAGINLGFASTEIENVVGVDEPLDVLTLQAGLYAGYEAGDFGLDLYAGAGYNDFESERRVNVGTFDETAQGDWSGYHYNASASAGYDMKISKNFFARPSATITYLSLHENAYEETGGNGIDLAIDSRSVDVGTASAVINLGAKFDRERSWWSPSLRAGYRNDFINDNVVTTGRFVNGTSPFAITAEEFPKSGFLLGFSFASGTAYSAFALDYDADVRDGFIRHTGRIVVRLLF